MFNAVKNVRTLLENNAGTEKKGNRNKTAMGWARQNNNKEVVELLSCVSFCVFQLQIVCVCESLTFILSWLPQMWKVNIKICLSQSKICFSSCNLHCSLFSHAQQSN